MMIGRQRIADALRDTSYDALIGERGMKRSSGQRQCIAITRALLKDAPILILDEATANVDAANETVIQQALDWLTTNRITLIIAHRLSTVANCRSHHCARRGATEVVAHRDLLRQLDAYVRLVAAQA